MRALPATAAIPAWRTRDAGTSLSFVLVGRRRQYKIFREFIYGMIAVDPTLATYRTTYPQHRSHTYRCNQKKGSREKRDLECCVFQIVDNIHAQGFQVQLALSALLEDSILDVHIYFTCTHELATLQPHSHSFCSISENHPSHTSSPPLLLSQSCDFRFSSTRAASTRIPSLNTRTLHES